jgi:tRNA-specific 2-thiouridylase
MRVASQLGIPFVTLDFEEQYRRDVVENMFREFQAGRTPNPDVMCNKFIKFDRFVKAADELGCEFVATGHYARIVSCHPERSEGSHQLDSSPSAQNDNFQILMGSDPNKDQTYFLWAMPREVLSRVLFPIGHMLKPDVRKKARELGLSTAEKKDSTGICFVGEVDMREFLQERIPEDPGEIVTTEGKVVGEHSGVAFYTIGQRHGLNVGGGTPYYVVEKKPATKQLVVSSNFHPALFKRELTAIQCNWFRDFPCPPFQGGLQGVTFRCQARIRYRQPVAPCSVTIRDGQAHVVFDDPQRAVTPGQSIVFYDGEEMLGGGIIE